MKRTLAFLLALMMIGSAFFCAAAEAAGCTVRPTPVFANEEQIAELELRFYPEAPHVPYLGIKEYLAFLMQLDLTVEEENGGFWRVTRPDGSALLVNPAEGTVFADDWASFQNPPAPYEGRGVGVKDTPCAWSIYPEVVFEGSPRAVTFDFGKYGIALYADKEDVYLPLSLLSTLFTDTAFNYVVYSGEKIFKVAADVNTITSMPAGYYESEQMRALLTGRAQREEDVIRRSYAELCFILGCLYGHPEASALDEALAQKGLDAALSELPDGLGDSIREDLLSPDMKRYMIGLTNLFFYGFDDGHTLSTGIYDLLDDNTPYPEIAEELTAGILDSIQQSFIMQNYVLRMTARQNREEAWGDEVYRECGSTAILRIDAFDPDIEGWEAYYAGEGEIPMDALGITWTGLRKASENPKIKNILFDLTSNEGGCQDVLMAMVDLAVGENQFRGYNRLTDQYEYAVILTDKNLDGVIDEKDQDVKYDFNYAVLTTRASFSCGNLFPSMMHDNGAVILGETTGGGSCCVLPGVLSGGGGFLMSCATWTLRAADGASLESGFTPDLPIARTEPEVPTSDDYRTSLGDYTDYFSDEMLDQMITEWFAEVEALAA